MAIQKTWNLDGTVTTTTISHPEPSSSDIQAGHWANLRLDRNSSLAATDVWALSDRTMSDAQKKYRQDLRDLPANTSDPEKPTWPNKP